MNRVSPADTGVVTGEDAEKTDAPTQLLDKPLFIYVTDGSSEGSFDKIEKVVLDDNKVLVGMKAFKAVKMSPGDVQDDPLLSGQCDDSRYFLFVSRDLSKVSVVDDRQMKAKNVYKMLVQHAKIDYETNLDRNVKATLKLLLDFDKINNAVKVLNEKKARLGPDAPKAKLAKIERELEELAEAQKEAEAKRDELLKFELKQTS